MFTTAFSTKTTSSGQPKATSFPILKLPPELWIQICRRAVASSNRIPISEPYSIARTEADVRQPAITRTCRIIRAETLHWFYTNNTFVIRDSKKELVVLPAWIEAMIATGRWKDIKHCIIRSSDPCIRLHMVHCFEDREVFAHYRIRLIALEGENPKFVNRTVRRFKLELRSKDDPHEECRSVMYDDNGADIVAPRFG